MNKTEMFPRNPDSYREGRTWKIYDNSFFNYQKDFAVIDTKDQLVKRIQQSECPVVIDLMSSTYALSTLEREYLSKKKEKKLIAVGMEDERDEKQRQSEISRGIHFFPANLNKRKSWDDLDLVLGNDKADIIMERGYGGLFYVPTRPLYQRAVMNRMWNMLRSDGGMMILQTPPEEVLEERGVPILAWLGQLKESDIEHNFVGSFASLDRAVPYGMLMLQKNAHNEQLPDFTI